MIEEDHKNCFSHQEDQLPSHEELTPLTQTLITSDLAMTFDITINQSPPSSNPPLPPPSSKFAESGRSDRPARTLKRPRLTWTPELHRQFLDALTHLGMENAFPKRILQQMKVDGLTRENISSHLQKYRLFLKRIRGLLSGEGGDALPENLSAILTAPHHFLHQGAGPSFQGEGGEHYTLFMAPGNHQMDATVVEALAQQQHQQHMGPFGLSPEGKFENKCLAQQQQEAVHQMVPELPGPAYTEDLNPGEVGGRRKELKLLPAGDD